MRTAPTGLLQPIEPGAPRSRPTSSSPSPARRPPRAYRRALETATQSALPLTKAERRQAVLRLAAEQPELSHREISRRVGVSHDTVGRWLREDGDPDARAEEYVRPTVTADQVAGRLVGHLARLNEARGIRDLLMPHRMGQHLADAFRNQFGNTALKEAQKTFSWMQLAVDSLESDQYEDD